MPRRLDLQVSVPLQGLKGVYCLANFAFHRYQANLRLECQPQIFPHLQFRLQGPIGFLDCQVQVH